VKEKYYAVDNRWMNELVNEAKAVVKRSIEILTVDRAMFCYGLFHVSMSKQHDQAAQHKILTRTLRYCSAINEALQQHLDNY
jgi:hypothetical protein